MDKPIKILTLAYLFKDGKVHLSMKLRDFGKDKYNGFGGKLEGEESIEQGMIREVKEESGGKEDKTKGVDVKEFHKVGVVQFLFPQEDFIREAHIFLVTDWEGEPKESDEMGLHEWFEVDNLPFDQMFDIDKVMLPAIFSGKEIYGRVYLDEKGMVVNKEGLEIVSPRDLGPTFDPKSSF